MKVVMASKTDTGKVAVHNEDYVWVHDQAGVYIVADGMGGHEAGDVASRLSATSVGQSLVMALPDTPNTPVAMSAMMTGAIEKANHVVRQASAEAAQVRRMGATIVVVVTRLPQVYIAHAGDARVYLATETDFVQLTDDDSWVAQLAASGIISDAERNNNRLSHIITKAIGQGAPVDATITHITVQPGNWLLMCSDGLWNMVDDEQIFAVIQHEKEPAAVVKSLVQAANEAGGKDNISVIALKIE